MRTDGVFSAFGRHRRDARVGLRTAREARHGADQRTDAHDPGPTGVLPTVKIAARDGLVHRRDADAAPGLSVNAFATGLDHPRWLYVLPNGDVLVAETNRPPTPDPPAIRSAACL